MKILFVSPAIEEKPRGIGAIFKALIESAKMNGDEVELLVGYPETKQFFRSEVISDKLEHLNTMHYMQDGRAAYKHIAKRRYTKQSILETFLTLGIFRSKRTKVNPEYLSGPKTVAHYADHLIKSPYFFIILNYLPAFLSQSILNRIIRKYEIDMVVIAAPTKISNKHTAATVAHFVHDTMPLDLVETPPSHNTPQRYGKQFFSTCKNSDIIFANSNDTAGKVLEANPDANVHVLHGTASSRREDVEEGTIMKRKGLKKGKFLLFTSAIEKRKNVESLMKAYATIHDEVDMPLVIVGGQGYGYDDIIKTYKSLDKEVQRKIKFLGYVSEADKFQLFDNAFAFVFPSVYEGMGLMLIEAMQSNIPIITSNKGALPEAGGDAAYYIEDPYDIDEIARAILTVKNDPKLVKKLVAAGKEQQKKFTLEKFAGRFSKAIKSVNTKSNKETVDSSAITFKLFFQVISANLDELIIIFAIFINQFSYWPTFPFESLNGFSLEITMFSSLIIAARGLYIYRQKVFKKLFALKYYWVLYLWWAYGVTLALTNADKPEVALAKGLYFLTVLVGAHFVGAMYVDKRVSARNIVRGWMSVAFLMAPLFIAQYIAVMLGADIFSKRIYQVGVFEFPRLHGFSFEPLYFANWLLVPTLYAIVSGKKYKWVATTLSLLIFLSLARGAIIALVVALLVYALVMRPDLRTIRMLFQPVFRGFMAALILVAISSQINGSTALQGSFRYLDHMTLGFFNESGSSNVSFITIGEDGEERRVIDVTSLDREGAVEASAISRQQAIEVGLDIFEDNPVQGVGLFRFGEEANDRAPEIYDETGAVANSQPIDILVETGLIGAGTLLAFVTLSRRRIFKRHFLTIALLALSVQFLFFTALFPISFWVVLALALAYTQRKEAAWLE